MSIGGLFGSIGSRACSVADYPTRFGAYPNFYGGFTRHSGAEYAVNPVTGNPHEPQVVPRGDYTRVLTEFWTDPWLTIW